MQAVDSPFTKIINGTTQFVIPVFQRDYSWTETQCQQLWLDILQIARDESSKGHFLGSVVYVSMGDIRAGFTRWLLIDGQQRLTTVTLLLCALRDHIRTTGWKDGENDPTAKRIDAYFLRNTQEEGDRQHKLVLRRHDQATLAALLDGGDLPANASERLRENYEFFRDRLAVTNPAEVYIGLGRLVIVDVTLDRLTDDPQLIFESLNSTGMDLSQSDLIRNFILMRLEEKEQTRFYRAYWSKIEARFRGSEKTFDAFARDYVALKTQASKQERASDIYRAFRRCFEDLKGELGGLEKTLTDLLHFAKWYAAFSLGGGASAGLNEALGRLRRLVDVPATLVVRLFECHERHESLSEEEFLEALAIIESYVLRRAICGEQTRGYWQVFANLAYKIRKDAPLESLKVGLARLRDNYRYPADKEFHQALRKRDLYGLRVCAHLLERLENHGSHEPTDTSHYSIEHILPQNEKLGSTWRSMLGNEWKEVQRQWLHRLGNLTLTGYNSTYSDRPFDDKKTIAGGFAESSVRLNKFVREQPTWTPVEMEHRGTELADKALTIWPPLVVDQALIDTADQHDLKELAGHRDVKNLKMSDKARELFGQLRDRVLDLSNDVIEIAESKTVSYYGNDFFLEVLPRKHSLTLLLALDFNEVDDPEGIANDATQRNFFFYAKHEGGVSLTMRNRADIEQAVPIIRQAYAVN